MSIKLVKERVGSQWLITSAELPGLFVADADLEKAEAAVPAAIKLLERVKAKRSENTPPNPAALA